MTLLVTGNLFAQKADRLAGLSSPNPDNKEYAVKVYAYILCDGAGGGCPTISTVRPFLDKAFTYFDDHRIHPYLACVDVIADNSYYLDPTSIASDPAYQHSDGLTVVLVNAAQGTESGYTPLSVPHFLWSIYDNPRTIAHEMGHRFGLEHTFESTNGWCESGLYSNLAELANGNECSIRGDYTCDTPPDVTVSFTTSGNCLGIPTCNDPNGNPYSTYFPLSNIMSYHGPLNNDPSCPFTFSSGQGFRMRTALKSLGTLPNYVNYAKIIRNNESGDFQFYNDATLSGTNIFYDDILINSGVTVTINGTLKMAKGKRIRVMNGGGKLVVNGQITSLDEDICDSGEGGMWRGIRLFSTSSGSIDPYGSECIMNGAKISNAQYAIDAPTSSGSIKGPYVNATNTLFLNNAISLFSFGSNAPNITGGGLYFTNCTFDVDEDFLGDYSFDSHAYLVAGINAEFLACDFMQSLIAKEDLEANQVALHTNSTNVTVDKADVPCLPNTPCSLQGTYTKYSKIDNFGRGVYAGNVGGMKSITIRNTLFKNCTISGVDAVNILTAELVNNKVAISAENTTGFKIQQTALYTISNNEFQSGQGAQGETIGISVTNGGSMNNRVLNNKYTGLYNANYARGANGGGSTGLEYICNRNYGSLQNDFYVFNSSSTPLRQMQGTSEKPAGNVFSDPTNPEGHFYLLFSVAGKIQYNALDVFGEKPTKINANKVEVITTTTPNGTCAEVFGPQETPWPGQNFTGNEDQYWLLRSAYDSLTTLMQGQLDGGSTGALVYQIENAVAQDTGAIIALLATNSPWVSAEVIEALFQRNDLFTSDQIALVCKQNPDVLSDASILEILASSSSGLDSIQLSDIRESSGTTSVRTELVSALHEARISSDKCVYHLIRLLGISPTGTDYSLARTWLGRLDYLETDLSTIWTYMAEGNWSGAKAVCQTASSIISQPAAYEWAEMDDFVSIMAGGLSDLDDLSSLDSLSESALENFATEVKQANRATTMAQSILNTYYGYAIPYASLNQPQGHSIARKKQVVNSFPVYDLAIFPNPAQGSVRVVLSTNETCTLRCVDQHGMVRIERQNYQSNEAVDITQLPSGLYYFQAILPNGEVHIGKVAVR